jgi:hypothetical protein
MLQQDSINPSSHSSAAASTPSKGNAGKAAIGVAAVAYVLASLLLVFQMHTRLVNLESKQSTAATEQSRQAERMDSDEAALRATNDALTGRVAMTEKDLAQRTADLQRQSRNSVSKLRKEQNEQMADVKGQVGTVVTDVASTKTDLADTKDKLDHAVGDLGLQSGLIARTREDVEYLRHRGDRNYYDFTLVKGKAPTQLASISLQLKKADAKRGKYTVVVLADDRSIEKKDRTMFEPMQFYTGKTRVLYEAVVFAVDKNTVSGYLSTPKEYVAQNHASAAPASQSSSDQSQPAEQSTPPPQPR